MESHENQSPEKGQTEIPIGKKKMVKKETLTDRTINKLKDNRIVATGLVLVFIMTLGSSLIGYFGNAIDKTKNVIHHYEQRKNNLKAMMAIPEAKQALNIIKDYFEDVAYGRFEASKYFASHVDKYILVPNLSSHQIDSIYRMNSKDFLSPSNEFMDTSYNFLVDEQGNKTIEFWVKYCCFRARKGKYEHCFSRIQAVFDKNNKLTVFDELATKELNFTDTK